MSLTAALLENRHAVWALALAIGIGGVAAWRELPVQLQPDTAPPLVNVVTPWPGAGAEDVAADLGRLLEDELAALEGIAGVRATAQDNLSVVTAEFQFDVDPGRAAVDVQNAVARVRPELPDGVGEPQVLTFSTSDRPVLTLGVASEDLVASRRLAEDVLAPALQRLPGVAAVDVFGGSEPAVLVDVDPLALEAHRLPLERVAAALRGTNTAAPAGRARSEEATVVLRVDGRVADVQALADVPIALPDGARVTVGELGAVRRGSLDDDARFAIDATPAIAVQVFKATDANAVEVVDAVRAAVGPLAAAHPGHELMIGEESGTFTRLTIDGLLANVGQALLLAGGLLFLFLGSLRGSAVALVSMPLSYGITFALMRAAGLQLDMVTLTAVVLAMGMVVDATVVVLENITRHRDELGKGAADAARDGTDEVFLPVVAGVATTLVVLLPLLFLRGFIGRVFGPLALTLLFAFLASVVVALGLVPVLSLHTASGGRLDRLGQRIARPFQRMVDLARDATVGLLGLALRGRAIVLVGAALTLVAGVGGMRAAGRDVLPRMDGGSFFVSLETPSGSSVAETARVVADVERVLRAEPSVVLVQSQAGFEPGMRYFGAGGVLGPTQGFVTATLLPRTARDETIWEIEARVRAKIAEIPGIRTVVVRELGNTAKATTTAPVVVRITGDDPLVLDRLGDEALSRVAAVPDVVAPSRAWRIDQRRVEIDVDTLRAGALGLSPADVARRLAFGSEGIPAGEWRGGDGSPEPVRVRFAPTAHAAPADLLGWPVLAPTGESFPLRAVAATREAVGRGLVTREDLSATLDVTAFVDGRPLSFVLGDVQAALADLVTPIGYDVEIAGESRDLEEAKGELGRAVAISIVAVYLLLVAQFRSFLHPITVMGAIPLSLSGVAAGLHLAGKPVSMPVMVGLVLLIGTVVNSSILLVDVIRRDREAGVPRREALLGAVRTRFRPILMTSLSTVVGMYPLAAEWSLGAERFSPLATAVMGGMISATFLTLIVIPVLYDTFDEVGSRLGGWLRPVAVAAPALLALLLALPAHAADGAPVGLSLEDAFGLAEQASPGLDARAAEEAAARHRLAAADLRLLPRADLGARYSRLSYVEPAAIHLDIPLPNGETPDPVQLGEAVEDAWSLRATVEQPLFAGGALVQGRRAAADASTAAAARTEADRGALREQVAGAWHGLALARALVEVTATAEGAVDAHRAQVGRLVVAGRATALDEAIAASRLAEARRARVEAEGAARAANATLAVLVGLEPSAELRPTSAAPPAAIDDPLARALADRPELDAARAAADAQDHRAKAASGALWPRAAARFGAAYENPNTRYFPVETTWKESWEASVVLNWSIDAGVTAREAAAARQDARAAAEAADGLAQRTRVDVAVAAVAVETADARVVAASEGERAALEAHAAAGRLFEAGRATSLDVLDREAELAAARAALARARADAAIARARLDRLVGAR